MDMGFQPVDTLMDSLGLRNHDLVDAAAGSGLTHKVVAKARRGRRLTGRAQRKVLSALNEVLRRRGETPVSLDRLFNYAGR